MRVFGYDRDKNYFGVTKTGTHAIKRNSSSLWNDITNQSWSKRQNADVIIAKAMEIKNILPIQILEKNKWNAGNGFVVAGELVILKIMQILCRTFFLDNLLKN